MNGQKHYVISEQHLQAIVAYLNSKPYIEVVEGMNLLKNLQTVEQFQASIPSAQSNV